MNNDRAAAIAALAAVYREVQADAQVRHVDQAPRQLFERVVEADVACVAESPGPKSQRLTGIPWIGTDGRLSTRGELLNRDLLWKFGYTADPYDEGRRYAYLTDVSHLWLGRDAKGNLKRPSTSDKQHSAPWLERELQAIRPRVVLLLGNHAASFFLQRFAGVSIGGFLDVVGHAYACSIGGLETTAVVTLHPTRAQMSRGGSAYAYRSTVSTVSELLEPLTR
jgi:uracil-DNA glycosylase family 4